MKRAQIQLEEETFEVLRQRAFQEKKSISGIIREVIQKEMALSSPKKPLSAKELRFIGAGKSLQGSLKPVSEKHDQNSVDFPRKTAYLRDLSRLLHELPKLGAEAVILKKDLRRIAKEQPPLPQEAPWE
jgi:hypothetical protein